MPSSISSTAAGLDCLRAARREDLRRRSCNIIRRPPKPAIPAPPQLPTRSRSTGGQVAVTTTESTRTFLLGGYTTGNQDYTAGSLDFDGFVAGGGVEHKFMDSLLAGIAGGYANGNGDISGVYPRLDNDQFIIAPYARATAPTGTMIDARISYAFDNWDYSRVAGAATAKASPDGHSFGAHVGVAQPLPLPSGPITIEPFASLSYLNTHVDGYTETGAGASNLVVPSYSIDTLDVLGGIGIIGDFQHPDGTGLRVYARGALGGNLLGGGTVLTSYTTSTTTFPSAIDSANSFYGKVEAGASFNVSSSVSFGSHYTGTFGEKRDQHTISGDVSIRF